MGTEFERNGEAEDGHWPVWLKPLLNENFFIQCELHAHSHKSECNMFCLDCVDRPLCSLCSSLNHKDHQVIQIRRSSYHDVIRASEIQRVLDISGVQTYVINSAKVVFLNHRPQPRPGKGVTNTCLVCDRSLLDTYSFCSLGCKVVGTLKDSKESSKQQAISKEFKKLNEDCGTGEKRVNMKMHMNFFPSMPQPTSASYRTAKRRKGIPHRAPLGVLIV